MCLKEKEGLRVYMRLASPNIQHQSKCMDTDMQRNANYNPAKVGKKETVV